MTWKKRLESAKMVLAGKECDFPEEGQQGWTNGRLDIDGTSFSVGGGWIHSADSAENANACEGYSYHGSGLSPFERFAHHEGDFHPYRGDEMGDVEGVMRHLGITGKKHEEVEEVLVEMSRESYANLEE